VTVWLRLIYFLTSCRLLVVDQVLRPGGLLWIAEVRSRFDGSNGGATIESFAATLSAFGFKMKGAPDESNKMFFTVVFVKRKSQVEVGNKKPKLKWPPLKACSYKRR